MFKVTLDFLPPTEPNIVELHVYESDAPTGSFNEIDFTSAVGTYPNYITRYTTAQAVSPTDWFSIAWEDSDGVITELSQPIQGGDTTLVQTLIDRVKLRDPSLNENVVEQEAETAISIYYGVSDPFSVDPTAPPRVLSGLTYMVMAQCYIARMITQTQANKWSAGTVSMDTSIASAQSWQNIDNLIALANKELERNLSTILLLKEMPVADGRYMIVTDDVSRSLIEIEIL